MSRNTTIHHFESNQFSLRALLLEGQQFLPADEISRLVLHHPAETRFERVGGLIDVVTIQGEFHLRAQGVPSAEAAGLEPLAPALAHQRTPDRGGVG